MLPTFFLKLYLIISKSNIIYLFQYLRNILYEYMMGKETKTLAKVISTVVNFDDEQKRNILAREDAKVSFDVFFSFV
ncbi:hypothetical protein LOTGIDRAFT_138720 [Lottia gigantea]|uniref:GRIP domain-containing protein n=1 Tax=Lottia gigantea TaxID=225164 RepID=V4AXC5_LOTGI|nr:hypothetical protein LOTGIDRAFT_138720 [Lottia gigantea]ESP02233.1 hypothetical protein LOTGIDRAFT_138720 [Lottia gigantea]